MPRRYPLTALSRFRAQRVDEAAAACLAGQAATEAANREVARAELATKAHVDALVLSAKDEAARLDQGELRAGDLVRHGAWAHVATLTRAMLEKAEGARREELRRAEEALSSASRDLTTRKCEADAVTKHEGRWAKAVAKRSEAHEADEIEDRWRSR